MRNHFWAAPRPHGRRIHHPRRPPMHRFWAATTFYGVKHTDGTEHEEGKGDEGKAHLRPRPEHLRLHMDARSVSAIDLKPNRTRTSGDVSWIDTISPTGLHTIQGHWTIRGAPELIVVVKGSGVIIRQIAARRNVVRTSPLIIAHTLRIHNTLR